MKQNYTDHILKLPIKELMTKDGSKPCLESCLWIEFSSSVAEPNIFTELKTHKEERIEDTE
jgi:hypothetical protein